MLISSPYPFSHDILIYLTDLFCMYLSGQPIYGYGSMDDVLFRNAPTKDGDIFFVEDKEISLRELAMNVVIPTDPGQRSVKGEISVSQIQSELLTEGRKGEVLFHAQI